MPVLGGGGLSHAAHDARSHVGLPGVWSAAGHAPVDHTGLVGLPGAWTSYVPAWTTTGTAPAIGNGSLTARYLVIPAAGARLVYVELHLIAGTTTTFGTGSWRFSLPFAASAAFAGNYAAAGLILDSATDRKVAGGRVSAGSALIDVIAPEGGSDVTNTVPMTWANLDELGLSVKYLADE